MARSTNTENERILIIRQRTLRIAAAILVPLSCLTCFIGDALYRTKVQIDQNASGTTNDPSCSDVKPNEGVVGALGRDLNKYYQEGHYIDPNIRSSLLSTEGTLLQQSYEQGGRKVQAGDRICITGLVNGEPIFVTINDQFQIQEPGYYSPSRQNTP